MSITTGDQAYHYHEVRRQPSMRMSLDAQGRQWLARIQAGKPRKWWERRLWPLLKWWRSNR